MYLLMTEQTLILSTESPNATTIGTCVKYGVVRYTVNNNFDLISRLLCVILVSGRVYRPEHRISRRDENIVDYTKISQWSGNSHMECNALSYLSSTFATRTGI